MKKSNFLLLLKKIRGGRMNKFLKILKDLVEEIFSPSTNVQNGAKPNDPVYFEEDSSIYNEDGDTIAISRTEFDRVAKAMYGRLAKFLARYDLGAQLDTSDDPHSYSAECPEEIDTVDGQVTLNDAVVFKGTLMDIPDQDNVQCIISLDLPIKGSEFDINDYNILKEVIMDLNDKESIDWNSYNVKIKKAQASSYNFVSYDIKLNGFEHLNGFRESINISMAGAYYCVEYTITSTNWKVVD